MWTKNPPLRFPRGSLRGGGWWTFPAGEDPISPHTPGTKIRIEAPWLKTLLPKLSQNTHRNEG